MTSILQRVTFPRFHFWSAAIWLAAGIAFAQPVLLSVVAGEVRAAGELRWQELTLIVEPAASPGLRLRAFIRPDGSFEVRDVPSGTCQVSVTGPRGEVLWYGLVPTGPGAMRLIIELDKAVRSEEHAETISVTRLRQKPSRAATRELRLAQKASGQNQMDESIVHLRRAVELAPEMQDAHNNLGAKYLRCADYEAAVRELEIAVALDPGNPMPHLNLSLALLALNRTVEAQDHARSALRRDPLSPGGNFVTGVILDRQGRSDEALRHLEISSTHVSEALLIEARILFARSEMGGAITKLREYVSRPGSPRRAEVTRWLEEISAHDAH